MIHISYVPEGMLGSDCAAGVSSGVPSGVSPEESAGELSGEMAEVVGPLAADRPSKEQNQIMHNTVS